MNPKQKKTREETAAESHFTVNKEDVKHATEKYAKEQIIDKKDLLKYATEKPIKKSVQNIVSVEKEYSVPEKKALETIEPEIKIKNKSNKKNLKTKTEKYTAPKISLNKKGYELIITYIKTKFRRKTNSIF
ncbi:hypothetical protein HYS72_01320 [Candidatus Pacearchaeota archaeon]|nr:hypothetical protein [Candidatus Pacearchaeota archaeon]